jgi:hemerythrin
LPLQGVRLEQFLQLWLVNHVLLFDAEVAAHLRLTRQDRTGSRG